MNQIHHIAAFAMYRFTMLLYLITTLDQYTWGPLAHFQLLFVPPKHTVVSVGASSSATKAQHEYEEHTSSNSSQTQSTETLLRCCQPHNNKASLFNAATTHEACQVDSPLRNCRTLCH
eukprot:8736-Heterococcus_DN1.PRE.2